MSKEYSYFKVERHVRIGDKYEWWQDPQSFPGKEGRPMSYDQALQRSESITRKYGQHTRIVEVLIREKIVSLSYQDNVQTEESSRRSIKDYIEYLNQFKGSMDEAVYIFNKLAEAYKPKDDK